MRPALPGARVGRIGVSGLSVAVARPRPGRRNRAALDHALALCLLSSSCAFAPIGSRAQQSAASTAAPAASSVGKPVAAGAAGALAPATRELAVVVEVAGRGGRLNAAQRSQLLARLGQQGHASLLNRQLAALASVERIELQANNQARLLIDGPARSTSDSIDSPWTCVASALPCC